MTSSDGDSGVDGVLREGRAVYVCVCMRVQQRRPNQHGVLRWQRIAGVIGVKLRRPLVERRNKRRRKGSVHAEIRRTRARRVEKGVGGAHGGGAFRRRASGFQQAGLGGTGTLAGLRLHAVTTADGDHRSEQNEGQEGAHDHHEGQIRGDWRKKDKNNPRVKLHHFPQVINT